MCLFISCIMEQIATQMLRICDIMRQTTLLQMSSCNSSHRVRQLISDGDVNRVPENDTNLTYIFL